MQFDFKAVFLFAAVERQNSVAGQRLDFFGKLLVHFVNAEFFAVFLLGIVAGRNFALFKEHLSKRFPQLGVVGHGFGHDVLSAGNRVGRAFHALFGIDKLRRYLLYRALVLLLHYDIAKRLQTLFDGDRGARLFLLFVRTINVFHFGKRRRLIESGGKFVRPLALSFYCRLHFFLSLLEIF